MHCNLTGDRRHTKQFLLLRRRLSSGGEKAGQFSAFGREIPCEKVTVKQLITLQAQLNSFSINRQSPARFEPARQTCLASQKPTALPNELSGLT